MFTWRGGWKGGREAGGGRGEGVVGSSDRCIDKLRQIFCMFLNFDSDSVGVNCTPGAFCMLPLHALFHFSDMTYLHADVTVSGEFVSARATRRLDNKNRKLFGNFNDDLSNTALVSGLCK